MASLGHVAVGMAAARFHNPPSPIGLRRASQRPSWSSTAAWSALSMLPDVIGFLNGVPYEAPWGHRGATHSFTFAIVVGLVVGLVARRLKQPALRTALFATAVVATHPLLDTFTDGGLGALSSGSAERVRGCPASERSCLRDVRGRVRIARHPRGTVESRSRAPARDAL
jgi:inner membrane protein